MKRKIFITLILTILSVLMLGALSVSAGNTSYSLYINDVKISTDVPLYETEGEYLAPARAFADGLKCKVDWDGTTKTVIIYDDENILKIPLDSNQWKFNSEILFVDVPAQTINSRTMLPIRDVVEILGYKYSVDLEKSVILIETKPYIYGELFYKAYYSNVTIIGCSSTATSVTIPAEIEGKPVTTIKDEAFSDCTGLISVTIPDSITTIGNSAFYGCTGLTSVTIPDGVTTIGDYAFYNCTGLTSVTIPDSVTTIRISAFYGCTGLTSVTIPDSVTSIGSSVFSDCTGLTSVTIPDGVTTIGDYAFYNCTGLTSVTIPDSVTSIGCSAFEGCTGLTSVTIPDSVTTIGGYAFRGCTGLTSVTIPDSVTTIGISAFHNCTGLTKVNISSVDAWCNISFGNYYSNPLCYAKKLYLNGNLVTDLVIPDSVTTIGYSAFYGCTGLTSVTIPDSVTTIENSSFYNCTGLTKVNITSIEAWCNIGFENEYSNPLRYAKKLYLDDELVTDLVIPDSVTTIGDYAFYKCTGLTNVTIGEGVELIPENAFYGCSSLDTVCLSDNVLYIRNDAFNGCSNLTTVFYAGDESKWNEILFYNRNENLTNAKIIYNAIQKTYSFVTNCDEEMNDITGYAVFSSPVINNEGSTLVGWYDNEELSGNPVAFPYYGDNTTLYASWTDKTGASFDDALTIRANQEYTVTTTTSGQLVYFEFVPKKTKEYKFYSIGSKDTYGYLYNSKQSRLTYDDDNGDGNNFLISYKLTKGETYYIAAKVYNGTGTFTVIAEEPVDYTINSIVVKDSSGKEVSEIPQGTFSVTVSFTNVASNDDAVIVLARYNSKGTYKGLMNVTVEDVPAGATMKLTLPVDNINGDVAKIKAFCWASVGSVIPVGNSVTFPAQ